MNNRMGPPTNRQENPLHLSFRNPAWPPNFINKDNVLDYFCNQSNTFYDMSSCNQQLRMQSIQGRVEDSLRTINGIQYVLWYAQPPLYIICKQNRNSALNVSPIAYYYVINGSVHQAPDMFSMVQSRLLGALEPLRNAFQEVTNYSRYNPAQGYFWEFKTKSAKKRDEEKKEEEEEQLQERSTNFQGQRTLALINQLFEEMPADDALEKEVESEDEGNAPVIELPSTSSAPPPAAAAEPKFAEPAARPTAKQ